jgi:hypothetical protein
LGHLDSHCPERKKKKKESKGPETAPMKSIEDFASKFDKEFYLVTLVLVTIIAQLISNNQVKHKLSTQGSLLFQR